MKARKLIFVAGVILTTVTGCQTTTTNRPPRWEIAITANVEYKPDAMTVSKAGIELKRPLQIKK